MKRVIKALVLSLPLIASTSFASTFITQHINNNSTYDISSISFVTYQWGSSADCGSARPLNVNIAPNDGDDVSFFNTTTPDTNQMAKICKVYGDNGKVLADFSSNPPHFDNEQLEVLNFANNKGKAQNLIYLTFGTGVSSK